LEEDEDGGGEDDLYDEAAIEEEEEDPLGYPPEDSDAEEEEDDYPARPKSRPGPKASSRGPPGAAGKRPPPRSNQRGPPPKRRGPPPAPADDYEEDEFATEGEDYDFEPPAARSSSRSSKRGPPPPSARGRGGRGPPPRRGGPPNRRGDVVPYGRGPPRRGPGVGETAAATLTKGWSTFTGYLPDPSSVKTGLTSSISTAREATSGLSATLYREVKGLTSSELEQVMLKATRPDDTPVKGKHVERLVGVTYQVSARIDIYDAVLRKLWKKMAEKDSRTTLKALYILHRYSADGAPEHAASLKARLRELRRTKDPKRKDKYFNNKQMLAGDTKVCYVWMYDVLVCFFVFCRHLFFVSLLLTPRFTFKNE